MTIFLLGAQDPEMKEIEWLLDKKNQKVQFATHAGDRVRPDTAYEADPAIGLLSGETLVCIECRPAVIPHSINLVVVDHHRPGDPGWGKGPAEYWEASSIGQVYKLLGLPPTPHAQLIAAMDHCFAAAIRGECPGVEARKVLDYKVTAITTTYRALPGETEGKIELYRSMLRNTESRIVIGSTLVIDMSMKDLGVGYSLDYLCAQVAVAITGVPALLRGREVADGPTGITLYGADASTITAFMQQWGPANDLVGIYGVPERGYAGGYLQ